MTYETVTRKVEKVNLTLQAPRFEIEGHYSDYNDELTTDWKVSALPQSRIWEFLWWEADENYQEIGLTQHQIALFEDRLSEHVWEFFDRWDAAMTALTAVPAHGADTQMTTNNEKEKEQ